MASSGETDHSDSSDSPLDSAKNWLARILIRRSVNQPQTPEPSVSEAVNLADTPLYRDVLGRSYRAAFYVAHRLSKFSPGEQQRNALIVLLSRIIQDHSDGEQPDPTAVVIAALHDPNDSSRRFQDDLFGHAVFDGLTSLHQSYGVEPMSVLTELAHRRNKSSPWRVYIAANISDHSSIIDHDAVMHMLDSLEYEAQPYEGAM